MKFKYKILITTSQLKDIQEHIYEILRDAGKLYLIEEIEEVPYEDDCLKIVSKTMFDDELINKVALENCMNKLSPLEQQLIHLIYFLGYKATGVIELFQQTGKKFFDYLSPDKLTVQHIFKTRDSILKKLKACLSQS